MKKYIGIIASEILEIEAVKSLMDSVDEIILYNLKILRGTINSKDCLLVKAGVGKVNAARTTQILIDKFDIDFIVNFGSAGALNNALNIGDLVIGENLVQHDFDVTAFGRDKGYISDTGKFFQSDGNLLKICSKIKINDQQVFTGTIASGDIFCTDINMKEKIHNNFNADCVEMEGAAIAQVCHLCNIPFIVIRSISDIPNGENQIEFNVYLKIASRNCAEFIHYLFVLL